MFLFLVISGVHDNTPLMTKNKNIILFWIVSIESLF
jgi:hypothetical protein